VGNYQSHALYKPFYAKKTLLNDAQGLRKGADIQNE
jgi:hypothetical protein